MESSAFRGEKALPDYSALARAVEHDLRCAARARAAEAADSVMAPAAKHEDTKSPTVSGLEGVQDACIPQHPPEDSKPAERKEELPMALGRVECRKDSTDEGVRGHSVSRHVWHPSLKCPVCIHVRKLCQQAADILGRAHDQCGEHRSREKYVRRREFQCRREVSRQHHSRSHSRDRDKQPSSYLESRSRLRKDNHESSGSIQDGPEFG